MSDLDHAQQMLAIARRDLKALGGMLDADIFAYEIFGSRVMQNAFAAKRHHPLAGNGRIFVKRPALRLTRLQVIIEPDVGLATAA